MKILKTFFKAIFSSGLLGLVMLLMAATILWGSLRQGSKPFEATLERMKVLNKFQNEIAYALNSMQTSEAYAVFVLRFRESEEDIQYEETPESINQYAESANADLEKEMSALQSAGQLGSQFPYATDLSNLVQAFKETRSAHRETFGQTMAALEESEDGHGAVEPVDQQLEQDNQTMNSQLADLITSVEQDRLAAQEAFTGDINQNVAFTVASLTFCLLLALVGYQAITLTARPLRSLRNMITAIGGDQYRPETQGNLLKTKGEAGNLARALDRLAREERARTASLREEIETLRQELYESRRKRLKIFHPASQEQEGTR